MKIIFLDIDGVVTSLRSGWFNLDIYTVNFLRWLCKEAGAKIVISSTWRHNHGKDFWEPIFGEHLHNDFKTPSNNRETNGDKRGGEIQMWLDNHPNTKKYLILDDDDDMLSSQMDSFIQTDSLDGMLHEHMMKCRDYFGIKNFFQHEKLFQHENMFDNR